MAIYDKALEYISGGSNVPDIKAFFWQWRRHHHPQTESSLGRSSGNLIKPKSMGMSDLGVFGGTVADEMNRIGGWQCDRPARIRRHGPGRRSGSREDARYAYGEGHGPRRSADGRRGQRHEFGAAEEKSAAMPGDDGGAKPLVEPTVRTKFADTALWVGALTTDADGMADVSLNMPENLTTWRIKVWGMGQGTRVGQGFTDVVTRKDLIVRLEAPRFFVQKDEVTLSAIVHNYLENRKTSSRGARIARQLPRISGTMSIARRYIQDGKVVKEVVSPEGQLVEVAPNGEARVDWRVKVLDEGEATIRVKALTDEESDAMEQKFPCYIHGMLKMDSYSGSIRPKDTAGKFTIDVPADRRPAQSLLEVHFSPTLAGAMVDALPYLVDYPYGCTEQTLNRFLPTVVTQKVLLEMNLNLKEIEQKRTNLNAQELGNAAERAAQWGNRPHPSPLPGGEGTRKNPVFDEDEVRRMVKDGVQALQDMQCSDGGWGWFSGWGEHSTPHTTALVVHGLQIAQQNDVALVPGVLERGVAWLKSYQNEQVQWLKNAAIKDKPAYLRWKQYADNLDAFVYMVLVDAGEKNADMLDFLYRDRTHLGVYAMAMYGLALEKQASEKLPSPAGRGAGGEGGVNSLPSPAGRGAGGEGGVKDKLAMILRNISQYVEQDDENQTAWLRLPEGVWWYWYGSEYEADAYYLKLLARTDPKGELAPRLVKYLLNNRKHATYWNSTRDTAICIEAMADFLRASGENRPDMTVEVYYDGKLQKAVEITPKNLFQFDSKFVLEGDAVASGRHTVELKKKGRGPLYYNGYLTTFTLEDFIKRAGLEIKVNRKYYKLVKADKSIHVAGSRGQAVEQKVEKYERQELQNLAELKSGDLVEVELTIDSKNDYEYLVFEDMKPAGFETLEVRSGYNGNDLARTSSSATIAWCSSPARSPAASTAYRTGCGRRYPASSVRCRPAPGRCTPPS